MMNLFKKRDNGPRDIPLFKEDVSRPNVNLHELDQIAMRDRFYHTCWLELKHRVPDARGTMDEVELYVAGLGPGIEKQHDPGESQTDDFTVL